MDIQPDFKELLELFNAHDVDFMIVGGYALAFHGAPRTTGDIDIYVKPDPVNAKKIMEALTAFGFGTLELSAPDFEKPDHVVQLGVPPVRIDLITSISGVSWDEAAKGKVQGTYGTIPVWYIGRSEFLKNKKSSARKKDLADIESINVP